ncbi:MAG: tryptophan--tRNA ligase [Kiritimatiellales bacterium]
MRILSGIQPSGKLHLGNYFGMMKPALELQNEGEAFLFIADYHALTTVHNAALLREQVKDVALDFLAAGLDPERTAFYRQSDLPEVQELTWLLSVICPMGLLERAHSYKDKVAKGFAASHGLFTYPVLMAADILIVQAGIVPVGRDQKQHVEITRDLAMKFNNEFGETFKIPEPSIRESVAVVPGVDGQKMSKSYGNTLEIFGDPAALKKRVMQIVTDCTPLEDPKNPDACTAFALYKLFASDAEAANLAARYRAGGFGYGTAKKELLAMINDYFTPLRARRAELEKNMDYVEEVLQKGAAKARVEAHKTLKAARKAVGLE